MVNVAERTVNEVDAVLWLVEPTTFIGAGEQHIAKQLSTVKTPVILVINKIDTVKKGGDPGLHRCLPQDIWILRRSFRYLP